MTRHACRTDRNHKEISDALKAAGYQVHDAHQLGRGVPDLAIWRPGTGFRCWVEVKMPGEDLTDDENYAFTNWLPGPAIIAHSGQEAVDRAGQFENDHE